MVIGLVLTGRVTAQNLTVLHSFTNSPDGAYPYATLIQAKDGDFYSTTERGGVYSNGVIFKITSGGDITSVAQCNIDGVLPADSTGALLEGDDGIFYGVARVGGPTNLSGYPLGPGAVFTVTTNGVITTYGQFGGTIGSHPVAAMIRGPDGNFYGATKSGGGHGNGAIYELTTNGTLVNFYSSFNDTNNGSNLYAGLVLGSDANFYGATIFGGTNDDGTLFKITTNAALTTLVVFNGANGAEPYGTLLLGNDGNFYGTTYAGGESNLGTVFKVAPNNVLTTLVSFDGSNGANPDAGLIQGTDGDFYGTTYSGGASNLGTVFRMTTNGTLSTLISFEGTNGANPYAPLLQDNDGNFYGTTVYGGINNVGTVFRLTLSPVVPPTLTLQVWSGYPLLSLYGTLGDTYTVQYSTDLADTNWTPMLVVPNLSTNPFQMIDPSGLGPQARFYRAVQSQ